MSHKSASKEEESSKEKSSRATRIKELEEELRKTKYNKRTQHHIGLVKAKIARLKEEQQRIISSKGKSEGYSVRKTGDATVIIVGFPSVGKSTLLNKITNAESKVADYEFTTLTVIPGMLNYKHAKIQLLDVPGLVSGAASGKGRGKEVLSVAQSADLILILLDVFHPEHLEIINRELYDANLRLNQKKPDIKIKKTSRGGLSIGTLKKLTKIDKKIVELTLKEFKIINAHVLIRENITQEQLIDAIEGNKRYIPSITILNKIDLINKEKLEEIKKLINPDLTISAEKNINLNELKEVIFKKLDFIRIYCKEVGKKPDLEEPLIMKTGCTIRDVCLELHKDFVERFRFARVWGKSARFPGQDLRRLDHKLVDNDIIEVHLN